MPTTSTSNGHAAAKRRYYSEDFKAKTVNQWRAAKRETPGLLKKDFAEALGVRPYLLADWERRHRERRTELRLAEAVKRRAPAAAGRADGRTFEAVSLEFAAAVERVRALKRELRELIGDD
jgi:DNA-binding transcriptional regulator YiaG